MTISAESSVVTYIGNGSTTSFPFSFVGVSATDIEVIYTDTTGTQSTLDPSTYTLVLTAAAPGELWGIGGTVTYPNIGSPIALNTQLSIVRVVPYTQDVSISNQGAFYPKAVEQGFDLLELQLQQTNTDVTYAIKTPITDPSPPGVLPPAAERANLYLGFDSLGQPIVLPGVPGSGGNVSSVALSAPAEFVVTGSPITTTGTLTITKATESANVVYAGPTSGSAAQPTFRTLVAADIPVATSLTFGSVKPDNTSISISGGVISVAAGQSANPTATAGPIAVNGTSSKFMRADAAPAVQLGTNAQKGIVQVDGTTITASSGVITAVAAAGSVTTTGSPASGNLTKFSGTSTITNGNLSGDVTTSGSLITTLAASGVTPTTYGDATHVPQVAVDSKGRITSATSVAITAMTSSVGLSLDSGLYTVTGSPVTTTGTLTGTLNTQTAGTVLAGATSGGAAKPAFRALVQTDLPGNISLGFVISGKPSASQNILYAFNYSATMPTSLTGGVFKIGTNPTGTMTFTLTKNGSSIGSIAFSTLGVATPTFASPVSVVSGDLLEITAPGSQDATGADVALTFALTRV